MECNRLSLAMKERVRWSSRRIWGGKQLGRSFHFDKVASLLRNSAFLHAHTVLML